MFGRLGVVRARLFLSSMTRSPTLQEIRPTTRASLVGSIREHGSRIYHAYQPLASEGWNVALAKYDLS